MLPMFSTGSTRSTRPMRSTHLTRFMSARKFSDDQIATALADHVGTAGVGGSWVLANTSYACMRAQNDPANDHWRIASFVWGFPGTACSYFFVKEGSERAYGVDLPRKKPQ